MLKLRLQKNGPRIPVMEKIHVELKEKGVTLQLLWHEYKYDNPEGYGIK
jgi:hypothetical protein